MNELDEIYRCIFSQTRFRQKFKMFITLILFYIFLHNFENRVQNIISVIIYN